MANHGWVRPNPDGSKARCGGPSICPQCSKEYAAASLPNRVSDFLPTARPDPARGAVAAEDRQALMDYSRTLREPPSWQRAFLVGYAAGAAARDAEIARLRGALEEVLDFHDGDCRLDHTGFCQAHASGAPCVIAAARTVLEAPR